MLIDQIRHSRRRQHRIGVDQRQMQPNGKPRQATRELHSPGRRRRSDHQTCGSEDAFDMRALNRLVDFVGKTEVVGRDDQIFQCAVS
jgi:hypothetical protein